MILKKESIFLSGQKMTRKSSRIQDWVNFNIKSLGDSTAGSHDSDSGFEQSTKSNDFHSLYVEPWTNCHDEQTIKNRVRWKFLISVSAFADLCDELKVEYSIFANSFLTLLFYQIEP